ncbi:hypothetical protein 2 [Hubei myriapoda virus 2]|uniref:hypothetical protein 2 n=1 Tax=Hubei myriapoda virus 2 TaxID=1922931 RepID=UPI00090CD5DC|nr:hypothetical protein 2 [Hubei myriapoda virus 2]APG78382.1 hypothetical protein 2 [Hubei myriapoda virus 2]
MADGRAPAVPDAEAAETGEIISTQTVPPTVPASRVASGPPPSEIVQHTGNANLIDPNILNQNILSSTITWSVNQPQNSVLGTFYVHPSYHLYLDYLSRIYYTWSGSLQYSVCVLGTGFHAGKIMLVRAPPGYDLDSLSNIEEATGLEWMALDPKSIIPAELGLNDYRGVNFHMTSIPADSRVTAAATKTFACPEGGWGRLKHDPDKVRSAVRAGQDVSSFFDTIRHGGILQLRVMGELKTSSTGNMQIQILVFVKPGPDFQFSTLIPPTVKVGPTPSQVPAVIASLLSSAVAVRRCSATLSPVRTLLVVSASVTPNKMWFYGCASSQGDWCHNTRSYVTKDPIITHSPEISLLRFPTVAKNDFSGYVCDVRGATGNEPIAQIAPKGDLGKVVDPFDCNVLILENVVEANEIRGTEYDAPDSVWIAEENLSADRSEVATVVHPVGMWELPDQELVFADSAFMKDTWHRTLKWPVNSVIDRESMTAKLNLNFMPANAPVCWRAIRPVALDLFIKKEYLNLKPATKESVFLFCPIKPGTLDAASIETGKYGLPTYQTDDVSRYLAYGNAQGLLTSEDALLFELYSVPLGTPVRYLKMYSSGMITTNASDTTLILDKSDDYDVRFVQKIAASAAIPALPTHSTWASQVHIANVVGKRENAMLRESVTALDRKIELLTSLLRK